MSEMKILQNDFFMDRDELQSSVRAVMLDCPAFRRGTRRRGQATPESEHPTVQSD